MAQKLENLVQVLTKTVEELVSKVESLQTKLDKQSELITKLTALRTDATTRTQQVSTKNSPASEPGSEPPQPRPVRVARKNASLAVAQIAKVNKRAPISATPRGQSADTSEIKRNNSNSVMSPAPSTQTMTTTQSAGVTSRVRATPPAEIPIAEDDDDDADKRWQVVSNRRRRTGQLRTVTVGVSQVDHELQAVERTRYIQAWQFKADTTVDQIKQFLNKIVQADYFVEKRQIKSDRHASFIIGMPENVYSQINNPTAWPQGIRFAQWFFRSRSHSHETSK